jgi:putative phosphoesterase
MIRVGLISDTHGLLRPEAVEFLRGSDRILHGGDIGNASVLEELAAIALVTAVRGNNDHGEWADRLPESEMIRIGDVRVYMLHDVALLDIDPKAAGASVVVAGHSHKPRIDVRDGIVYINPGSAGPRRFTLPVAVGELIIDGSTVTPRIVELEIKNG